MSKTTSLGEFESLILLAVLRLGSEAYGVSIRREIFERTGRDVSPGAIYTTLQRLEKKELVSSDFGASTPQRGGKRKRCYGLRPEGARALQRFTSTFEQMTTGLGAKISTAAAAGGPAHED